MEEQKEQNKPKLLFVVIEDWCFVSHQLQLAVAARESGYDVATRARQHAEKIQRAGVRLISFELSRRVGNPLLDLMGFALLSSASYSVGKCGFTYWPGGQL